jgi:hypothetical protein
MVDLVQFQNTMRYYQRLIKKWLCDPNLVGEPQQFESIENRSQRFFEEATELVQATGLTEEQCHTLVSYVFNRPVGWQPQEVGGVMVCLAALCERIDLNAATCLIKEAERIHQPEMIEKVRNAIVRKRNDGVGI